MAGSVSYSPTELLAYITAMLDAVSKRQGKGDAYFSTELEAQKTQMETQYRGIGDAVVREMLIQAFNIAGFSTVGLRSDEPLTDAAIASALSDALGVRIVSIKDKEALKAGMREAAARKVSEISGDTFENLFDRALLRRDLIRAVGRRLAAESGLQISDLSDKERTKREIMEGVAQYVFGYIGIPVPDFSNDDAVREAVVAWAAPQIQAQYEESRPGLKRSRRAIQLRSAQRKFRAAHPGAWRYEPL